MKYFLMFFLIGCFLNCKSSRYASKELLFDASELFMDSIVSVSRHTMHPYAFLNLCLDSLKMMRVEGESQLPFFLKDYDLDRKHPGIVTHRNFSMRKSIFDSIQDKEILLLIINSDNPIYKQIIDTTSEEGGYIARNIPFWQYSNFDLAEMRLQVLEMFQNEK
jgi:hypothetical protein